MKTVDTFECKIYVGHKEGYSGKLHFIDEVESVVQEYCDKVGFGVTITPAKFIYKDGSEYGCIVGIINYPRFPKTEDYLEQCALQIAFLLKEKLNQLRVSIVGTNRTIMLEDD